MTKPMTIRDVARLSGLSATAIRFYEDEGYIPPARRSESGYRLYNETDLRRLRLIRRARLLGVPLEQVRDLAGRAFGGDCAVFAAELIGLIELRRVDLARPIAGVEAVRDD